MQDLTPEEPGRNRETDYVNARIDRLVALVRSTTHHSERSTYDLRSAAAHVALLEAARVRLLADAAR